MSVTYTNEVKTNVLDPLKDLMFTEFRPIDVVFEKKFDGSWMKRGEYIRYWLIDSSEVGKNSDGETRDYDIEIVFYFDTRRHRTKTAFDDVYSDRAEHLKRLLDNYNYYDDGTYRWTELTIETDQVQPVSELEEDVDIEETMAYRFLVTIRRSNFR